MGETFTLRDVVPIGLLIIYGRDSTTNQVMACDAYIRAALDPSELDRYDEVLATMTDTDALYETSRLITEAVTGRPTRALSSSPT